jgi:hypothetical protein
MTEEHKKKISEANKGQIPWTKGKHWSAEIKEKMSQSAKRVGTGKWCLGLKRSQEFRERQSAIAKKQGFGKFWLGKKLSKERRLAISKRLKGIKHPERCAENHPNWKNGINATKGYVKIYQPNHPHSNKKYVLLHRLVAEEKLGRFLNKEEVVHHINCIKNDNRIENLYLFTKREHDRYEKLKSLGCAKELVSNL